MLKTQQYNIRNINSSKGNTSSTTNGNIDNINNNKFILIIALISNNSTRTIPNIFIVLQHKRNDNMQYYTKTIISNRLTPKIVQIYCNSNRL